MADTLTRKDLLRYLELDAKRLALNREAKALEREQDLIEPKIKDAIRTDGKKGALFKWGYNLLLTMVRGQVKWKDEFIRVAGAEEASKVAENPPDRESLVIEKAA